MFYVFIYVFFWKKNFKINGKFLTFLSHSWGKEGKLKEGRKRKNIERSINFNDKRGEKERKLLGHQIDRWRGVIGTFFNFAPGCQINESPPSVRPPWYTPALCLITSQWSHVLKGYCTTPTPKLVCFVLYLKSINIFLKNHVHHKL